MATLTPLAPDADGTVTGITDEAGGTTNLYLKVTDSSDATYLTPGLDVDGELLLRLSDVDADFGTMDTLAANIRLATIGTKVDDTVVLYAQVFDGNATTTALTGEVTVASHTVGSPTYSAFTPSFTITGTPTKTQWNNAYLRLRWDHTKSMASDGILIRVSEASVTGTYTIAAGHDLTGLSDLAHSNTVDAVTITQNHALTVDDLAHSSTIDAVVITVETPDPDADLLLLETGGTDNLLLESGDHLYLASTAASTTLTGVADLGHSHTVDSVTLTQNHALTVDDLAHSHAIDAVTLTQSHVLTVDDLGHSHELDAVTLTQAHGLTVDDLGHASTIDAVTLTQAHGLTVSDLGHDHTVDAVTLTQQHNLTVGDLAHSHTIDSPAVSTAGSVSLTVGDLGHPNSIDAVTLTQQHNLTVGDLAHSHTADTVTLTQTHILTVNGLEHASTIDAVTLTQIHALATVDLSHAHTISDITFDTGRLLQIAAAALAARWRATDLTSDHDADPLVAHWSATILQETP